MEPRSPNKTPTRENRRKKDANCKLGQNGLSWFVLVEAADAATTCGFPLVASPPTVNGHPCAKRGAVEKGVQ